MLFNQRFSFFGPNRYAGFPACERLVVLSPEERRDFQRRGIAYQDALERTLVEAGLDDEALAPLRQKLPASARARFAQLFATTALALQRHAGHRVSRFRQIVSLKFDWVRAVYETENAKAGAMAGDVALFLMARIVPSLEFELEGAEPDASLESIIVHYREQAAAVVQPEDTRQLIAAAERAGVPWMRLDQAPFNPVRNRRRIRFNGGLALGQGRHRKELDGTFCRTGAKGLVRYVNDRVSLARIMAKAGAELPHPRGSPEPCRTLLDALEATERMGYPVAVKPVRDRGRTGVTLGVSDVGQLMNAVNRAHEVTRTFIVERMIPGEAWRLILAGGEVLCALHEGEEVEDPGTVVHASVREFAESLASKLKAGLMVLSLVAPDIGRPLAESGGAFVDLDLAPELDRLLDPESGMWERIMDRYVQWLFPPGSQARIPIVAVTGSNGKTTTCRMIEHLARHAGHVTGLACSEGLYLNGHKVHGNEDKKLVRKMRFRMMREPRLELAVMEYYLSRIKSEGFAFDFCNVGVLTNVLPEHLQVGLENTRLIAQAKGAVLERARDGVVLNADDPHTAGFLKRSGDRRVALTTASRGVDDLRGLEAPNVCCVVLENRDGRDRIVIHDGKNRIEVMDVADIPATFGGRAGFNVENALQAVATAHLMAWDPALIRDAMSGFEASFENTPGRLNIHDGWPFRIIMDYAHNGDGMSKLCQFTDALEVRGRRVLLYSVSGDRQQQELEATVLAAKGHFDHYVLRDYPGMRGREPGEIPALMQEILLEAGVSPEQLSLVPNHAEAIEAALAMGRPGDLLVMTAGMHEMPDMWARVESGPAGSA